MADVGVGDRTDRRGGDMAGEQSGQLGRVGEGRHVRSRAHLQDGTGQTTREFLHRGRCGHSVP